MTETNTIQTENRHTRGISIRARLRLFVELYSLLTIFLFLGLILFSTTNDTMEFINLGNFKLSWYFQNSHMIYRYSGWLPCVLAAFIFVLMFIPSKAERFGNWIVESNSHQRLHGIVWIIFWPILMLALGLTSFIGLVDITRRLPDPTSRSIAVIAGAFILLIAMGAFEISTFFADRRK